MEQALSELRRAFEANPEHWPARSRLARRLLDDGRKDEAATLLRGVRQLPRNLEDLLLGAEVFTGLEPELAENLSSQVLKKNPDHVRALFLKARNLLALGRPDEAVEYYARAAALQQTASIEDAPQTTEKPARATRPPSGSPVPVPARANLKRGEVRRGRDLGILEEDSLAEPPPVPGIHVPVSQLEAGSANAESRKLLLPESGQVPRRKLLVAAPLRRPMNHDHALSGASKGNAHRLIVTTLPAGDEEGSVQRRLQESARSCRRDQARQVSASLMFTLFLAAAASAALMPMHFSAPAGPEPQFELRIAMMEERPRLPSTPAFRLPGQNLQPVSLTGSVKTRTSEQFPIHPAFRLDPAAAIAEEKAGYRSLPSAFEALPVISPGSLRSVRDEVRHFWQEPRAFPEGSEVVSVMPRETFDLVLHGPEFQARLYLKAGSRYVGEPLEIAFSARDSRGPVAFERIRGLPIAIRDTVIFPMELANSALVEITLRASQEAITISYYVDDTQSRSSLISHEINWRFPPLGRTGPDTPGLWYSDDFPEGLNLRQLREISRENHVSYDEQPHGETTLLSGPPPLSGTLGYDRETGELPGRLQSLSVSGPMWKMRRIRLTTTGRARLQAAAGEESGTFDQGWRAVWALEGNARTNAADLTFQVR